MMMNTKVLFSLFSLKETYTNMTETNNKINVAVEEVLRAAEIDPDVDPIQTMERWLGIRDPVTYEGLTVEDCVPLNSAVYEKTVQLLMLAWDPFGDSASAGNNAAALNFRENALLESPLSPNEITLHPVWYGFLVTRWIIQWMEYNLASESEDDRNLWIHLLRHDSKDHLLVKSVFVHLRELQVLRSHMNGYTQHLRQKHQTSDMQSRLQHYQFVLNLTARLEEEWEEHIQHLEIILIALYRHADASVRKLIRKLFGRMWHDFVHSGSSSGVYLRQENTQAASIALSLRILRLILSGVSEESFDQNSSVYRQLITQHLIPLHRTNAVVLWRDQTPVIELYHEALTQCLATMVQKKLDWMEMIMPALLEELALAGNTSKQVLLLHEVETLLKLTPISDTTPPSWWTQLLRVTAGLMSSEHSRVAECALQLFRNKTFSEAIEAHFEESLRVVLPALIRSEPSWNPTVRKMTYNALYQLQESNATQFESLCNKLFYGVVKSSTNIPPSSHSGSAESIAKKLPVAPDVPQNASIKASMGTWRPPAPSAKTGISKSSSLNAREQNRSQPPSTITGVAPWTVNLSAQSPLNSQPPSTITGVAPWALSSGKPPPKRSSEQMRPRQAREEAHDDQTSPIMSHSTGFSYVQEYMTKIKPPDSNSDGISEWSRQQLAETPTLLPSLKFHDLVFGHELGSGAFSVVKYARLIDRTKTRSSWAEYAVKIISTDKIHEMSYETSVQREIAVLRLLSHPGVARLISSFRFREGAYMVLEYASRGDLHSVLREHGSMNHDSCRFIIGEVAAALDSIHSIGLVYSDLKPGMKSHSFSVRTLCRRRIHTHSDIILLPQTYREYCYY